MLAIRLGGGGGGSYGVCMYIYSLYGGSFSSLVNETLSVCTLLPYKTVEIELLQ